MRTGVEKPFDRREGEGSRRWTVTRGWRNTRLLLLPLRAQQELNKQRGKKISSAVAWKTSDFVVLLSI